MLEQKIVPSLDFRGLDVENVRESDASHVVLVIGFIKVGMVGAIALLFPLVVTFV